MVEIGFAQEIHSPLEKDPSRIHRGLWLAMSHGNKHARQARLQDFEDVVLDVHSCVIKPVVEPEYRYLLDNYRTRDALVLGGIVHPARWRDIPQMMRNYSDQVKDGVAAIKRKHFPAVADFIDLASFAHYQFYKIHPFLDGHKRTARQLVDTLSKHLGFGTSLITIDRKEDYLDAIQASTVARDIRHFSIFQSELLVEAYRGRKDPKGRYCFDAALSYRAHLIREVKKVAQDIEKQRKKVETRQAFDVTNL